MKGFLRWFKSGAKMKRWVVIILIGVTLCCYGMMKILTGKELEFMELARIITVFVIGFGITYSRYNINSKTNIRAIGS